VNLAVSYIRGLIALVFPKKVVFSFFAIELNRLLTVSLFCVDSHGPNGIPAEFPIIFLDAIILLIVFLADLE
jgi:hypothetical protein